MVEKGSQSSRNEELLKEKMLERERELQSLKRVKDQIEEDRREMERRAQPVVTVDAAPAVNFNDMEKCTLKIRDIVNKCAFVIAVDKDATAGELVAKIQAKINRKDIELFNFKSGLDLAKNAEIKLKDIGLHPNGTLLLK